MLFEPLGAGGAVNIHPELLPPFVELAPAYHPAPPVAVDLLIDRKSELTVPLALDSVWLAAVTEPMVKSLVDSPLAFQSAKVFVVPAVNKIDAALVLLRVLVMSLNVFEPVMVKAPAPPWFNVQLNVDPPPTNVLAVAPVIEIVPVPVPAVVVKLVGVALLNEVTVAAGQTNVPPLKVKFFVPVEITNDAPTVCVNPFKSSVPLTNAVDTDALCVNASCKVTEPLGLLMVMLCVNVFAELVIVCVVRPANVIVAVPDKVIPVPFIQLP